MFKLVVVVVVVALVACTEPSIASVSDASSLETSEQRYWATQAALLDPDAYYLFSTLSGALDETVPEGETWYVVNSFAVYFNEPTVYAQDAYPLYRRSGFLRTLDSRKTFALPEGTRIRNNTAINDAYIHVAIPARAWAADERYLTDPRALYFGRLETLETLEIRELICEATGGGSLNDVVRVAIPTDFTAGVLVAASIYDGAWATFGRFNLHDEINNSHTVRFANTMLLPFRRDTIGGDWFVMQKGSPSDGSNVGYPATAFPIPSSADPSWVFPIKGSANVLYQVLPNGW